VLMELIAIAGHGFERSIAMRLKDEEDTVFEAGVAALARIGTGQAANAVASAVRTEGRQRSELAEKFLWRFMPDVYKNPLFDMLRDREFVAGHPQMALRLLDRARAAQLTVPRETLSTLSRLMYRFWRPALLRVGFKARGMLGL